MADELVHPHDNLFRKTFADPREAAGLLCPVLPAEFRDRIDWNTLAPVDASFVDDELRRSEADLLFKAAFGASHDPLWIYVLLEHQSTPDRLMPFRMLKYCMGIWDAQLRETPQGMLHPIVPVVFYQGASHWNHSTRFDDLFPEPQRRLPWMVRFEHYMLDQTRLGPGDVGGDLKGRIARLAMMAACRQELHAAIEMVAQLLLELRSAGEGEYAGTVGHYLLNTQDDKEIQLLQDHWQRLGGSPEGGIMSYAQQLIEQGRELGREQGRAQGEAKGREEGRAEGEARGEAKGRVNTVESLLQVGVKWDVIEAATGLNEASFQDLKERLAATDDQ